MADTPPGRSQTDSLTPQFSQADSLTPPRYRSGGTSLFNLEEAECCNVDNPLFETCQEKDIGISFDSQGWAECQVDHYMVGLRRSDCEELYCIEGLSCCKGGGNIPDTDPAVHSIILVSSCVPGDGSLINCEAKWDPGPFDSEGWWRCPGDKA